MLLSRFTTKTNFIFYCNNVTIASKLLATIASENHNNNKAPTTPNTNLNKKLKLIKETMIGTNKYVASERSNSLGNLNKFRTLKEMNQLYRLHSLHFDWWSFPIKTTEYHSDLAQDFGVTSSDINSLFITITTTSTNSNEENNDALQLYNAYKESITLAVEAWITSTPTSLDIMKSPKNTIEQVKEQISNSKYVQLQNYNNDNWFKYLASSKQRLLLDHFRSGLVPVKNLRYSKLLSSLILFIEEIDELITPTKKTKKKDTAELDKQKLNEMRDELISLSKRVLQVCDDCAFNFTEDPITLANFKSLQALVLASNKVNIEQ